MGVVVRMVLVTGTRLRRVILVVVAVTAGRALPQVQLTGRVHEGGSRSSAVASVVSVRAEAFLRETARIV